MVKRATLNFMKKVNNNNYTLHYWSSCDVVTDNFVSFESVAYPGCYLGVLANGQLKKPDKVSTPDNYDLFDIKNAER